MTQNFETGVLTHIASRQLSVSDSYALASKK